MAFESALALLMTPLSQSVPRVVLDTNVCLDLFFFHDSQCDALMAALRQGAVQAVTREDCRQEWLEVLHYPQLPIEERDRPGLRTDFDALVKLLPTPETPVDERPLPRCSDPDDQMFLELAQAAGARWLLSKDKALLMLHRRTQGAGLFSILLPQDWVLSDAAKVPSR